MSVTLARAKVWERVSGLTGALADLRASSTAWTRSARCLGHSAFAREAFTLAVFSLVRFRPVCEEVVPFGF